MSRRDQARTAVAALIVLGLLAATVLVVALAPSGGRMNGRSPAPEKRHVTYSEVVRAADAHELQSLTLDASTSRADVVYENGMRADAGLPPDTGPFLRQLAADGVAVEIKGSPGAGRGGGASLVRALLPTFLVFALFLLVLGIARRRAAKGGGGGGFGVPQTGLRRSAEVTVVPAERFTDIAGCDEAVEELRELVAFFHDSERFAQLGARMPSGVILHGDPGTGKTLLAKALAGEAGLAFYATSGSEFVEKFAGVGASRVRELFAKARRHEDGAVVFIDEIDAVGRARSSSDNNGEREQTLNQILVELDGFSTSDRVICIAATNRLDVLDPALLRPGRFGRHIAVSLPSAHGRAEILRLHAAGKPLARDVDLDDLAASMGGLSGAQLAEVANEAAIMAARAGAKQITRNDFREGYLRVLAGPKRASAPIAEGELEVIAAHEAGHVLAAEHGEHYEKAQQVTVEPRGRAMGLAVYGQRDRALHDPDYLHEALVATLAGRAAEQVVFGRISSGAANDLQKATELARRAVEELGFSPRLGQIVASGMPFSESTRAVVEAEIERMVACAYVDALELLERHRDQLDALRTQLLEQRVLERVDIVAAIGGVRRLPQRAAAPAPERMPAPVARPVPLAAAEAASPRGDVADAIAAARPHLPLER